MRRLYQVGNGVRNLGDVHNGLLTKEVRGEKDRAKVIVLDLLGVGNVDRVVRRILVLEVRHQPRQVVRDLCPHGEVRRLVRLQVITLDDFLNLTQRVKHDGLEDLFAVLVLLVEQEYQLLNVFPSPDIDYLDTSLGIQTRKCRGAVFSSYPENRVLAFNFSNGGCQCGLTYAVTAIQQDCVTVCGLSGVIQFKPQVAEIEVCKRVNFGFSCQRS